MSKSAVEAFKEKEASATLKLENTVKRDTLIDIEKKHQQRWQDEKVFEINSPANEDDSLQNLSGEELREKYPKFFGTFPYPYMNGSLHLGHGFTISKIEFATGFERMLGKRALFPVGFHCTGMPIKSAADKLVREIEMFGENFERFEENLPTPKDEVPPVHPNPASNADAVAPTTSATVANPVKGGKAKVAAKSTGLNYQFQIMQTMGVPKEEIKQFADPQHWLKYFPPIAKRDLQALGARVDWRRSFITTDANPYYDSFVRWQITRLRELEYIKFGKRHTIYSPKDGQPCMDHDRASGEGVGPQEYTGVKMEVTQWGPSAGDIGQKVGGKRVFMVAATLRPETMYGQTNCYVGTGITYGLYTAANKDELYLVTERAARNMAFQDILAERGQLDKVAEITGSELIGTKIKAPNSVYDQVYVLPMDGVLADKGTGVVTSVPSDSPDDYATLMDLRKKAEFYKIDPAWAAFEPVPVLETANYGDMTAVALYKKLKIQSQKDTKLLAEAKEIAYREGFYQGKMVVGNFKGMSVQDAKIKVRQEMIDSGLAFEYQEPENTVMSRSADLCVVALCDQWYMDYGTPQWKAKAELLMQRMNLYNKETRHAFEGALDWIRQWACARSYGLGTKMPFDDQFLVESLSDSTIYMSYYTIAHLLQGGQVDGQKTGPLGVTAEMMTPEIWDYVLSGKPFPEGAAISKEQADTLRREYIYFYPMDIRSSGKDLIPNHLTFCIYVHAALFEEQFWPRSMRANGHLMLNGAKMAKSTGNSLTLFDSIKKFGADATRLALADAGDGIEDANFEETTANAAILRLFTFLEWCKEISATKGTLRTGEKNFFDKAFEAEINHLITITKEAYVDARYKDALKYGFYELQAARDNYRDMTAGDNGMHQDLVFYMIRIQALLLTPFTPHFAEELWTTIVGETSSIQTARFPEPSEPVNQSALESIVYVRETTKNIRDAELNFARKKAKGKNLPTTFDPSKPKAVRVFIAKTFPEWQNGCVEAVKHSWDDSTKRLDKNRLREELTKNGMIKDKRAMPFCAMLGYRINEVGAASVFRRTIPFDEIEVLNTVLPYLKRTLTFDRIEITSIEDAAAKIESMGDNMEPGYDARIMEQSEPAAPAFVFFNV